MAHHVSISGHSMDKYGQMEVLDVVALVPLQCRHSSRIIISVTLAILIILVGKIFCTPTPHSGTALLDVVMLDAVLLTLVRGLTLS